MLKIFCLSLILCVGVRACGNFPQAPQRVKPVKRTLDFDFQSGKIKGFSKETQQMQEEDEPRQNWWETPDSYARRRADRLARMQQRAKDIPELQPPKTAP